MQFTHTHEYKRRAEQSALLFFKTAFFKAAYRHATKGFTLIEMMIVVAIIGILSAIAIPSYVSYRETSFNATSQHDLHNLMLGEEAEFASNQMYLNITAGDGPAWIFSNSKFVSKGIGYRINTNAGNQTFAAFSGHTQGTKVYAGDSNGTLELKTSTTPAADAKLQSINTLSGWGSPL